jgi:hypothetical protein
MPRKMSILRGSFPISATPMSALEQTFDWQILAELGRIARVHIQRTTSKQVGVAFITTKIGRY